MSEPGKDNKLVHDHATRIEALTVLALHHGNRAKAEEVTGIAANTISNWAYGAQRDEYRKIRSDLQQNLREESIEVYSRRAEESARAGDHILERMMRPENLSKIAPRDLPNAYRNAVTGAGIYSDKVRDLRNGTMNVPQAARSIEEIARSLKAAGVTRLAIEVKDDPPESIESTATEVPA